jgi:hypothetical protein
MTNGYRRLFYGVALLGVAALAGCSNSVPPFPDPMLAGRIGDNCTVYFRRDALGMAAGSPSSPLTGNHNGADTQVSGQLVRLNAEWLVVADGKREFTIPKAVVLLIEMQSR